MRNPEEMRKELEMLRIELQSKLNYGHLHFEHCEIGDQLYLLGNAENNLLSGTELTDVAETVDSEKFIWWISLNFILKIKRPTIFITHSILAYTDSDDEKQSC